LSNSVFKGTILASGAVNINANSIIEGRVLTTAGNYTFGTVTAFLCDLSALPLQLVNFDAEKTTGNNVLVSWVTAGESNVLGYEVQVSINGLPFEKIGMVAAKGNNYPTMYTLKDLHSDKSGTRLYRLKMMDKDGSFTYSLVKSLQFSDVRFGLVNIFPNPAKDKINMFINGEARDNIILTITNIYGQQVRQKTLMINKGMNKITEDVKGFSKATYVVTIKNSNTGIVSRHNFQKLD
jgi:hypothetical protein